MYLSLAVASIMTTLRRGIKQREHVIIIVFFFSPHPPNPTRARQIRRIRCVTGLHLRDPRGLLGAA